MAVVLLHLIIGFVWLMFKLNKKPDKPGARIRMNDSEDQLSDIKEKN
jgi:hypothetical protein